MAIRKDPFEDIACRDCGAKALRLEMRPTVVAKPLGSHSLSGNTLKVSAVVGAGWPWCVCDACGSESKGKAE